jgi:hypothetical protein
MRGQQEMLKKDDDIKKIASKNGEFYEFLDYFLSK